MNIQLGTSGAETTFTNAVVAISRGKVTSSHIMLDGSYKIQEAPEVKRVFDVTLVKPTSTEVTNIETEYDKGTTLKFIHTGSTYTTKFIGTLDKSTGVYEIMFTLQEI